MCLAKAPVTIECLPNFASAKAERKIEKRKRQLRILYLVLALAVAQLEYQVKMESRQDFRYEAKYRLDYRFEAKKVTFLLAFLRDLNSFRFKMLIYSEPLVKHFL